MPENLVVIGFFVQKMLRQIREVVDFSYDFMKKIIIFSYHSRGQKYK